MKVAPEELEERTELFRVLGHPVRLAVLYTLAEGELSVGDLADHAEISMSMLSQQLAVLRRAELVVTRREGKQVFYAINNRRIRELRDALTMLLPAEAGDKAIARGENNMQLSAAMFARIKPVEK